MKLKIEGNAKADPWAVAVLDDQSGVLKVSILPFVPVAVAPDGSQVDVGTELTTVARQLAEEIGTLNGRPIVLQEHDD